MQCKRTGNAAAAKRENVLKKIALEWEAKRKAREVAGEPKPVSPYTAAEIAAARKAFGRYAR